MTNSQLRMHVTVVDETRIVTQSACRVLASTGARTSVAGSLQELALVFEATGQPDLLIINLSGHVTDWEITTQMRRCAYLGRILALVDDLSGPCARRLTKLGAAECLVYPTSVAALDEVLHRAILSSVVPRSAATGVM